MKKFFSLFLFLAFIAFAMQADGNAKNHQKLPLKVQPVGNPHQAHRSPFQLSILAEFCPESNSIEITADDDLVGNVYLYLDNVLVDTSDEICCVLALPCSNGNYTLIISGESWDATGYLEL